MLYKCCIWVTVWYNVPMSLYEDLAKFYDDPIGYVRYAFPWGEGALRGKAIRGWQAEFLENVAMQVRNNKFDGMNSVTPILGATRSGHGIGKALRLNDVVPTSNGLMLVGHVKKGVSLFGENGERVRVLGVKKYDACPFYRVWFNDGSSVDVSSGHLWKVKGRHERRNKLDTWRVLSTLDIVEAGVKRSNGKRKCVQWEIPANKSVGYLPKELPVDAYSYGVWLGDGDKRSGRITNLDSEVWANIAYETKGDGLTRTAYGLCRDLKNAGLFGCTTYNATVDRRYMENSSRLHVLQGLLDTDGWVEKCGSAAFCSASRQLVIDVIELGRSLGLRVRNEKFKRNDCAGAWTTHITWDGETELFRIKRKQSLLKKPTQLRYLKRWIENIEYIDEAPGVCFEVQGGLFLTKDYHVTHNSALTSWLVKWILDTRPYAKGVVTANTGDQLRTKTWAEVAKWHNMSITKDLFEYQNSRGAMCLKNKEESENWRCDALTSREEASESFAGLHAANSTPFYIMDEGSAIPNIIPEVAMGGLTDGEPMFFMFGNPTRSSGFFSDLFKGKKEGWDLTTIDSRTVEGTNKSLFDRWEKEHGEDSDFFRVRVRGLPPKTASTQFISTELVEAAAGKHLQKQQYDFAPKVLGVDVAWYGDDTSVIVMRQGLKADIMWSGMEVDSVDIAGQIASISAREGIDAVFIDASMGNGVIDQLRRLGSNPQPVYFNATSNSPEYKNKRAEMWGNIREWLKMGGAMPDDSRMKDELTALEYFFALDGRIQLESKKDLKKRGEPSSDYSDALALTFAEIVYKNDFMSTNVNNTDRVKTEYDVFE